MTSTTELSLYSDVPIESLNKEIRLLHILPGRDDEPICCKFSSQALDNEADYLALSYTWDTNADFHHVTIND